MNGHSELLLHSTRRFPTVFEKMMFWHLLRFLFHEGKETANGLVAGQSWSRRIFDLLLAGGPRENGEYRRFVSNKFLYMME